MRVLAIGALLASGLFAPAPARAAGVFVATAPGTASATFSVPVRTEFVWSRAEIAGTGAYGGLALYDDSTGMPLGGVVTFRAMTAPAKAPGAATVDTGPFATLGPPRIALDPERRYRLLVLGDTPVRAVIPLESGDPVRVDATVAVPATFLVGRSALEPGAAPSTHRLALPYVSRDTRMFLLARVEPAFVRGPFRVQVCAVRRTLPCRKGAMRTTARGGEGTSVTAARVMMVGFSVPGRLVSGRLDLGVTADLDPVVETTLSYAALVFPERAPSWPTAPPSTRASR